MFLGGYEIVGSKLLTQTVDLGPVRYNRNKRIQKKWVKKYGRRTMEVASTNAYFVGTKIFVHPNIIDNLREHLKNQVFSTLYGEWKPVGCSTFRSPVDKGDHFS